MTTKVIFKKVIKSLKRSYEFFFVSNNRKVLEQTE